MFTKTIVEEVISDASQYSLEEMKKIAHTLENKSHFFDEPPGQNPETEDPKYYLRAPRNSIIGRTKSEGKNTDLNDKDDDGVTKSTDFLKVYFPFFSSHLTLPVKPGEEVWTLEADGISYWVTRVHCYIHTEDVNFVHPDRCMVPVAPLPIKTPERIILDAEVNELTRAPNFPDGSAFDARNSDKRDPTEEDILKLDPAQRTFKQENDATGLSHYEVIYESNRESDRIVYEPVPILTQRPGDLVLQGSNNTTIILGTERGYNKETRPDGELSNSRPSDSIPERAGSIDIVAGRGRFLEKDVEGGYDSFNDQNPESGTTRPRVIKNIREDFERDKNPGIDSNIAPDGGHVINVSEGDPDFRDDASRVYVSMKSSPDLMIGAQYPQVPAAGDASNAGADVLPVENKASIIVKSDEVRIVARQDPVGSTGSGNEINGSVKIIKEGVADARDSTGRSVIMMQPDGTIMIDGPKIVLGSGFHAEEDGHGGGQQLCLGVGAEEPLVLGNQLVGILTAIINVLDNHIHPTPAGPSSARIPDGISVAPAGFSGANGDDITDLQCLLSRLGKTL